MVVALSMFLMWKMMSLSSAVVLVDLMSGMLKVRSLVLTDATATEMKIVYGNASETGIKLLKKAIDSAGR